MFNSNSIIIAIGIEYDKRCFNLYFKGKFRNIKAFLDTIFLRFVFVTGKHFEIPLNALRQIDDCIIICIG